MNKLVLFFIVNNNCVCMFVKIRATIPMNNQYLMYK